MSFEFSGDRDVEWVRRRLIAAFGWPEPFERRPPAGQLIKSMISARTRDEISLRAYLNLRAAYPNLAGLAAAPAPQIEALIADVTFADVKARRVKAALGTIAASRPDFDLGFLRARGVRGALAWLERLPGVGRKASASTLNFSTLNMPAMVIDTHILRILCRIGITRRGADTGAAFDRVMTGLAGRSAEEMAAFHITAKRLGQQICRPDRPFCARCPLGPRCRAALMTRGALVQSRTIAPHPPYRDNRPTA